MKTLILISSIILSSSFLYGIVVRYIKEKKEKDNEPEKLIKGDEIVLNEYMYDLKNAVVLYQIKSRVTVRIVEREEFGKMITVDRRYCNKVKR